MLMGFLALFIAIVALAAFTKAVKDLRSGQVKRGFDIIRQSEEPGRYRLHNFRWFIMALLMLCLSMSFLTEPHAFASPRVNAVASFGIFLLCGTNLIEAARFSVVPNIHDSTASRKNEPLSFWYVIALSTLILVLSLGGFVLALKNLFGSIE